MNQLSPLSALVTPLKKSITYFFVGVVESAATILAVCPQKSLNYVKLPGLQSLLVTFCREKALATLICLADSHNGTCQPAVNLFIAALASTKVYCAEVPSACVNKWGLWYPVRGKEPYTLIKSKSTFTRFSP